MQLGQSSEFMKLDLHVSNAYRIIPVHSDDQPLLSACWEENIFIDRALPFGLRSAPKIFNVVADFLACVLYCIGILHLIQFSCFWTSRVGHMWRPS